MSNATMVGRDIYIRTTSANGNTAVTQHRVWNAERFITAQQREAVERANKDGAAPDIVTSASAEEYRDQHRKN